MKKRTLPRWWMKKRAVAGLGWFIPFVLIYIFTGAPTEIAAQEPLPLEPGVRVRVTALDCGLSGRATGFRALRADTLVLETTECPLDSVTRLEVSRGQKSHAMLGAVIGASAGVFGAVAYCKGGNCGLRILSGPENDLTSVLVITFGVVGIIVGAKVGNAIKTDLWEEVPLERLQVSLVPQRDGRFALGFSVRF